MKKSLLSSAALLAGIIAVILVWYGVALKINSDLLAPTPLAVCRELFAALKEKSVYKSIIGTFSRSMISFSIAFVIALVMAVAANTSVYLEKFFYPLVALLRVLPAMAAILLCLIWLKSAKSPIAISFIVVFPMAYSTIFSAIKNRDKDTAELLKVYGVKPFKVFWGCTFQNVFEKIFPELVSLLAFNVKLTVSGEALANTQLSIGREMYVANAYLETGRLMAFAVIAVLLSVVIEIVIKLLYKIIKGAIVGYARKKSEQAIQNG